MSKKSLEEIQQQIEKLKEKMKKEEARIKKEESKERTKRLIHQGAMLEFIYGELGKEQMEKLMMELRYLSKKTDEPFFKYDAMDRKKMERETLSATQKKSLEILEKYEHEIKRKYEEKFQNKEVQNKWNGELQNH